MENCSAIVKLLLLSIIICLSGHLSVAQNYVINTLDGDTIAACTGSFYDSGSSTGNYSDNEKFTVTFHAPGGKRIIFDFTSLKLVAVGGDTLRIFDGADTLSTIIGTYAGIEESPFTVQSTDSALTFQFTSDGSLVNEGWEASISCCSIPITSDITGSNSECVNSAGVSYSVTETSGSKYEWFITGGTQASGTNTNSITVDWGGTSGPASVKVVEDNGCTLGDTVVLNVTLNALPVVSFSGLDTVCQITGPPIALTGDPAGGVFTGDGISGSQFSPAVAGLGTHQIIYSYSDLNLCESSDTQYVDVRNFDQIAEAIWLTDLNGWCSGNAQYTNVGATADGPSPGCWSGGVGNNVWFKFNATTSAVNIEVKTGEAFGSMRGQQIALWNSNNVLVKCIEAAENYGVTLPLSIDTLTPGHTYWISVDDRRVHGTFTLCIDDNASYDYRSGAVEITDINNYCSADAEYANTYATADGSTPSCWTGGVGNNVWFKFDALSNGIIIDVETGGTAGTMRGQQIALWNEDGTQIMCANADYSHVGVLSLSTDTLTAGHTYYISVDDRRTHGTFKLYVNDSVSYDYQSGAIELADIRNYQSADEEFSNEYMTADGNTPPCWSGGVGNNVWFKFDALSNGILIDVETGGTAGTMRGQQIALWNEAGVLVNCANADYSYVGVLSLSTDTLTAGHTYYISVDDRRNQGTFKLSVNDSVSYDFQSGAIELDDIKDYQSADEEFSNKYMTADGNVPPCWAGGVGNNVWFKFDAISEVVKIDVLTGNSYGTMRGQQIALWNEAGTLVKCASAAYNYSGELSLQTDTLTIGNTYWISVDDRTTNGTFTLAIDNEVGFDYKIGAIYLIDLDGWSSADAEYDNTYATEDESAGSCWTGGAGNNVWFKFEAATPNIAISVVTGAGKGTMRGQQIALWNENNDQVGCMNAAYNYSGVLTVSADTLTVGKYYWISVDDRTTHGTFTLEVDNKVPFDLKSGAILLTDLDYWCSDAAAYNNTYATFDEAAGSCWSGGSDNNVWFKFVAISGDIQVDVKTGNPYGSMRGQQIALWNEAGTQVQCANAAYNFSGTLTLTSDTLTPGRTYYISVDDRTTHGTFTLCVNNKAGFDYPSGAKVLPHVNSWCSALANYTNTYATADGADPSCWAGGVGNNVWYKFTATTSSLTFKVITGGSYGTMRGQQIALWREDGTEVKCANAGYNYNGVLSLSIDTLTIGYTYYISVDDRTTHGSFSVCISNEVDYDYKAGAILLSDLSSWSSAIAEYSNTYATADESAGSCWAGGVGNNVWFKFIATTNSIDIDVVTGGAYGTMRGQQIALWREDGTEVKCANAGYNYSGALSLSTDTLTIGHTYYVSVDDRTTHGTFTLEIDDTPSYDFKQGAILLADLDNWTSNMAEYDNSYATPDESAGSCWAGGVGNNVWFKFVAISGEIEIQVITGGLNGTMRGQQIAIWNEAGDQLQCANAGYNFSGTLSATIDTLTSGRTYYISVDDRTTHGTFTLYVNNKVGFDFKSGAIELTKLDGWCSSNAAYNNTYATAGDTSGTCWSGTSDRNVWFTFEAIFDTLTVDVVTGEAYGTMRGQQIALWNEAGNQVACKNGAYNFNGTLQLKVDTLSPGRRYWISIDERTTPGTFSLCINNVSNIDYWAIANGNWNDNSSWSRTEGGTAASTSPSRANNVYIKGYSISVTDAQSCANLEVDVANSNTSLTVDDGTLSIKGDLNFINSGADYTGSINLLNAGIINVNADLTVDRSGGSSEFKIELLQGSKLNISNNASISSSTGTTSNVEVVLGGSSELNIENDFIMSNTGGPKVVVTANNSSVIDVNRHIEYNSTASDKIEIELNDNANLLIAGNFYRGASNYGILNCNGNSTLVFNGQSFIQTLPKNSGGGTDSFSYQNIKISNTKVSRPQVTLDGNVSIYGKLTLSKGVVRSTSSNLLTIENNASVEGASPSSYIYGPLKKVGNQAFTFDIGDANYYKPFKIEAPSNGTDGFLAEYYNASPHPAYDTTLHEASITYINKCEYWTLDRTAGTSDVNATLYWDVNSCCIANLTNLGVAVWSGSQWDDNGNGGTTGTTAEGSIKTGTAISTNSNVITFANSLPIVSFSGLAAEYCEDLGNVLLTGLPKDDVQEFSGPGITDNGDGTATFSPSGAGAGTHTITYTYINSASGCSNSSSQSVEVLARPTANMFGTTSVCSGANAELSILFTGASPYDYTYTDGTNFFSGTTSDNPFEFLTSNSGTYSVTALKDANGCVANNFGTSAVVDQYTPQGKPTITTSGITTFCQGGSVTLSSSVSPTFYLWSNGETTQDIQVTESGKFSVQTRDANACVSEWSDETEVVVNPLPGKAGRPSGENTLCQYHGPQVYTTPGAADAIATEYVWVLSPGDAGTITGNTTSATVNWDDAFTGVATITVQGNNACGSGPVSNPLSVTINSAPLVNLGDDRSVCGSEVLDAENPGSSYLWSTGAVSQTITVSTTGTYWVRVTSGNGCVARDTVSITVHAIPTFTTHPLSQILCEGQTLNLSATVSGSVSSYSWEKDGVVISNGGNVSGADTNHLVITNTVPADGGNYTCVITSFCGSSTSNPAVIEIYKEPTTGAIYHIPNNWGF